MTTFRGVTHNDVWGNIERVQVLRDEIDEVEMENGEKEERGYLHLFLCKKYYKNFPKFPFLVRVPRH